MGVFKKTENITGKYKELLIIDGNFTDPDTGEVINVLDELERIYGNTPFSLNTSAKVDVDLD